MVLNYTAPTYVCTCCGVAKERQEFGTQSYTGQRTNQCKDCINIKRGVKRHGKDHSKFVSKEKCRAFETPDYTISDWRDAMLHFGGKCCYCGKLQGRAKKDKFDREHFVPVSRGGKTNRHNIGPSCRACNRGRGNKKLFDWYRKQPFWDVHREERVFTWLPIEAARSEGFFDGAPNPYLIGEQPHGFK